ncbi:MAG: acyltransferase [Pseudomonadota bacterium]
MRVIPALDGLRGLAVALVLLRHAAYLGGYQDSLPPVLGTFMLNGWVGVDLFFILSGFLISRPFFSGRPFAWKPYLTRRALRILPPYLFVLGAVVAGWVPFYVFNQNDLGWRVFYHLLFLQDYLRSDIVIAFWSLGVEEKFYLLAPVLLPLILRTPNVRLQFLLLAAVLSLGPLTRALTVCLLGPAANYPEFFGLYRSPFHACLDGLFWGVLLARLEAMPTPWATLARAKRLFWIGGAALASLMISHELLDHIGVTESVLRPTCIGLIMTLLVGAAVFGGAPHVFEWSVARWLGRISYSLYLIHIPLIYPAAKLTHLLEGSFALFLLIYTTLVLAVSHLMHVLVEQPFLNLKSRMAPSP